MTVPTSVAGWRLLERFAGAHSSLSGRPARRKHDHTDNATPRSGRAGVSAHLRSGVQRPRMSAEADDERNAKTACSKQWPGDSVTSKGDKGVSFVQLENGLSP